VGTTTRDVIVTPVDTTAPMITLNGDSPMTISEGDFFTDPGAFSDDGSSVTVTGTVDPNVPGTYTLTYIAVDEAGNVGTTTRDVIVTPVGVPCSSHGDCSGDIPFCYNGFCDACDQCEYCYDGIDGTCGPCGATTSGETCVDMGCYSFETNIATGCRGLITGGCDDTSAPYLNPATDMDGVIECQALCAADNRCNCFTYVSADEGGFARRCYLRDSCTPEEESSSRISGPKICCAEGTTISGETCVDDNCSAGSAYQELDGSGARDIAVVTYYGSTELEKDVSCCRQCSARIECEYWVRATNTNSCWLRSNHGNTIVPKNSGNRRGGIKPLGHNYRKTSGFCQNIGCEIISSVQECNTAATALGLPHVSIHHDGGRLPGCFLYTRSNAVEFNYNLQDTTDWKDTDSICYCPDSQLQPSTCARPNNWCLGYEYIYELVDCDGDGVGDHTCTRQDRNEFGVVQTANNCADSWPRGNTGQCPALASRPRTCARPNNWCYGSEYIYEMIDCDGDGSEDHTCTRPDRNEFGVIQTANNCADSWPSGQIGQCPALASRPATCVRPNGWCNGSEYIYELIDCDGDGAEDHTCTRPDRNEFGVIQTANNCADSWPRGQIGQCPALASKGPDPPLLEDSCGGFRESTCGGIYFAAMQTSGDWNPEFDYKCPSGYFWMTKTDYEEKKSRSATCSSSAFVGYNQCGWNGYTFNNDVRRNYFRFKDTDMETHAWAVHVGAYDTQDVQDAKQWKLFAGIVCGEGRTSSEESVGLIPPTGFDSSLRISKGNRKEVEVISFWENVIYILAIVGVAGTMCFCVQATRRMMKGEDYSPVLHHEQEEI